jgi:hypothetical protein
MRRAGLKLNVEKCVFGVTKGKILGCLISAKKIEANPDKIKAIREMDEPKNKEGHSKVELSSRGIEQIHFQVRRTKPSIFQGIEGKGQN